MLVLVSGSNAENNVMLVLPSKNWVVLSVPSSEATNVQELAGLPAHGEVGEPPAAGAAAETSIFERPRNV